VIKFMGFEELVQNYKSYEDVLIKYWDLELLTEHLKTLNTLNEIYNLMKHLCKNS
jgi:hypothetical protein